MLKTDNIYVEVFHSQIKKHGQAAGGDVFLSEKPARGRRTICVLADGLGSGVKANVLATMTSTMALKYVKSDIDVKKASEIIMRTLPVCSRRKVGYSTFTIVDISGGGKVSIIEYDNPSYILLRGDNPAKAEKTAFEIEAAGLGKRKLEYSSFEAREGDRMIFFSDGVTQSGMGSRVRPLGWGFEGAADFVAARCKAGKELTAQGLAEDIVERAEKNDGLKAKDDITCAVINFRRPRRLLVMTGPPYDNKMDSDLALKADAFEGRKIICGGTTAKIIARELDRDVEVDLNQIYSDVPPASKLKGFDLVTEGTITLSKTMKLLSGSAELKRLAKDAAVRLASMLLESDIIEFVVGTKINEAHQDPKLPDELAIRRNLIRELVELLNKRYLKEAEYRLI
ncbi:stage II sporulation protein E [Limihaloglobus sulfuriphilus]|uniref:Stage II sporulation protein E n=1 Tax=Limihaloglobus sulfuriphilus TaxID=1851148 RepID=A0A1Q2MG31_9BACT|nr:SpoIIE family protein phosphatase [Limihaloglobus sulfuriphilus]AQQ71609.1 stage II sporulation protein E [Limihaloglobus sulfuriphilus]